MGCLKLSYYDQDSALEKNHLFLEKGLGKSGTSEKKRCSSSTYGFNGMEKDDEWKGSGNSYDFGARMYDPRVARFLSLDPKAQDFAFSTPYSYAANNPIYFKDKNGESPEPLHGDNPLLYQLSYGYQLINDFVDGNWNLLDGEWWTFTRLAAKQNKSTAYFNVFGMDVAVRNLNRYVEGKGGYDIFSYHDLKEMRGFQTHDSHLQNKVSSEIRALAGELVAQFNNGEIEAGEYSVSGATSSFREQEPGGEYKFAFGATTLSANFTSTITINEDGSFEYNANVYTTLIDNYDWNPEGMDGIKATPHVVSGALTHTEAESLKQVGANDFGVRAYYQNSLSGSSSSNKFSSTGSSDSFNTESHPETDNPTYSVKGKENVYDGRRNE